MKIVFCGSSLTGIALLKSFLNNNDMSITSVWTIDDMEWEKGNPSWSLMNFMSEISIPTYIGNPNQNKQFSIDCSNSTLVVSVNCKYILKQEYLKLTKLGGINVHGSLLPKYKGRSPNVWSIIKGEDYTGVTVHIMDDVVDIGPILAQTKISIDFQDTGYSLLMKQVEVYPHLVVEGINNLLDSGYIPVKQNERISSFFPKRKPQDGRIKWSWSCKRIYNWIRAQTKPYYPGAFTYFKMKKVFIWKSQIILRKKYNSNFQPGSILSINSDGIIVSTADYDLRILDYSIEDMESERDRYNSIGFLKVGCSFE